ncbi:MAG: TonB-dependent receptor plug domain-containing protein [Bacteroidetes bacterium]|nr:TonB-dependent receptor plug domain-containing protein [Bacteroidota bacterium]
MYLRNCIFFFATFFGSLNAQNLYQVYGNVSDSLSGEKIVSCIVLENGKPLAGTASSGNYNVQLPAGKHILEFSTVGYIKKQIEVDLQADYALHVELIFAKTLGEAVITAEKAENIAETSRIGNISIPAQAIKKIPTMFGESDVLKVLQLLPGVKPGMEGTSGLYVRGGSPDQNLILLDGTPLYNVSHLYGFFSVFNTDALNHVELTKGGFPARYGGRLSSVLDLTLKDGNMRKWRGSANLGLISSSGTVEGPIWKDKISVIVSARRTYLDALYQPLLRTASYNSYAKQGYYFYDLNGKINIRPTSKDQILLSWYSGDDKFYNNVKPNEFLYDGKIYKNEAKDELGWGNRLAAARWNHRISPKMTSSLIANFTRYQYRVYQMSNQSESNDTGVITNSFGRDFRSLVKDYGLKYDIDYNPNNKNAMKFGANIIYHQFSPGATVYKLQDDAAATKFDSTLGSSTVRAIENYVYAENDMILTPKWKVNYGLHYSQFHLKDKMYHSLQPRISARYLLPRDYAIKFSFVRMQQYIHLLTNSTIGLPTDLWVPSVKELKPEHSYQYNLGIAKTLMKKYLFTVEGYYKTMVGVLDYKNGANFYSSYEDWFKKVESGKGRSFGLEVFLQRKIGKLNGWISYTLSKTDRIFPTINFGERFPYKYDSRHNGSIVMIYDVDKKHTLGLTWVYSTGNAFTLANTQTVGVNPQGQLVQVTTFDKRNQFRGADYHRLDLMYTFHYPKKWGEVMVNAGLYNTYSRVNPFYYTIDFDSNQKKQIYRVGLFPVLPFLTFNFTFK